MDKELWAEPQFLFLTGGTESTGTGMSAALVSECIFAALNCRSSNRHLQILIVVVAWISELANVDSRSGHFLFSSAVNWFIPTVVEVVR